MIYLGTLGRMVAIKCPSSQRVSAEDRMSFSTTSEGRRKAQFRPGARRTWDMQTSDATTPDQVSALLQFVQGAWGAGPFVFVSADAPYSNLFTPDTASCAPRLADGYGHLSAGGPVSLEGTWAARSLMSSSPSTLLFINEDVPVLPGTPLTVSAWVFGDGARVQVSFYDASGANVGFRVSDVIASAASGVRSWVSMVAPATAVRARLVGLNCSRIANPAATWTDRLMPLSEGQGCAKAVAHAPSRDLVLTGTRNTYSSLSFTITEVG